MKTFFISLGTLKKKKEKRTKKEFYLVALDAFGSKLIFITLSTINVMFFRDEGLGANGVVTSTTNKAFFMPLPSFVFHLFHS